MSLRGEKCEKGSAIANKSSEVSSTTHIRIYTNKV